MLFAVSAQAAGGEDAAKKFAENTANKAVEILSSTQSESSKLAQLESLFTQSVDTNWIGKFVLGKHWKEMDAAKQQEYLKNYQAFLVKHYTANFKEYSEGTKFVITRSKAMPQEQFMVSMDINRPSNPQPVKVDYRLLKKGAGFGIIDIIVEGVSLLNTQRSEFGAVVQRKGVDTLIAELQSKL